MTFAAGGMNGVKPVAVVAVALLSMAACGESEAPGNPGDTGETSAEFRAPDRAEVLASVCSGCHMPGGQALVSLADWSSADIAASLLAYREDASAQSVMHRMSRGYSDADITLIADYLGRETAP